MFRILPALIILLTLMVGSRALEIISETPIIVSEIKASEEAAKAEEKPKDEGHGEKPEEKKDAKDHAEEKPEEKKDEGGHGDAHGDGHGEKKEEKVQKRNDLESTVKKKEENDEAKSNFTEVEAQILQSLVKRREEIEAREKDISLKEASLSVIEKNIDLKIEQLKALQVELNGIMTEYKSKEDDKVKSLVKIYESMKPAEAAKIFEQLQMSVLLDVADNMKEAKLAAVLAKMDTYKAKELTVEIANRRRIQTQ